MTVDLAGSKRRWAASVAAAIVTLAVGGVLIRIPRLPPLVGTAPATRAQPLIQLGRTGGADAALNDAALLHDQRVLFLPSRYDPPLPALHWPEAGESSLGRDARKLTFDEAELKLAQPPPVVVSAEPIDAITAGVPPPALYGLGRLDSVGPALPARGGLVEVLAAESGRRVLLAALPPEAAAPTDKPWRPMEFLASVDAAGLSAPLEIVERSDVEEADDFFRNYLVQRFRLGDRLPPGFYRVLVGP